MPALAGYRGRVGIGSRGLVAGNTPYFPAIRWQMTWVQEPVEVTSTGSGYISYESNGSIFTPNDFQHGDNATTPIYFKEYKAGYVDLDVTADILWDTGLFPFNTNNQGRIAIFPGTEVDMRLYLDKPTSANQNTSNMFFYLPSVMVVSFTLEQSVREITRWTLIGKLNLHTGGLAQKTGNWSNNLRQLLLPFDQSIGQPPATYGPF